MRGAVSVALVYHFFDFSDESEHVASIIGMTIIVVVFSTMVFGAVTKPLLDLMLGKGERLFDCCLPVQFISILRGFASFASGIQFQCVHCSC
jgi:aspartokinase-like uncharacterized kinase